MKIERIKKNHKKEIIIGGLIIICLISAITITTSKAKYKITENIELAKGTINYKPYDFKVMAMYQSENKTNYTEINEMPGKNYKINEEKSYCTIDNINHDNKAKIYTNKYGEHIIEALSKTEKCYIYFDKNTETVSTALGNIEVNNYIPDFSKIADTDEGIFKANDNDGVSYYWRGASTTNYLKFGGYCWRIVRINGDGTIRLIYDGTTCHQNGEASEDNVIMGATSAERYYSTRAGNSSYVGWTYVEGKQRPEAGDTETDSNVKFQTEKWYNKNIENNVSYSDKIAEGKYCNDRRTLNSDNWTTELEISQYYAGKIRLNSNQIPELSCTKDDIYLLKVGAITADEVSYVGGVYGTQQFNKSYYLFTGLSYWTMTPYGWYSNQIFVFVLGSQGYLNSTHLTNNRYGFRPVINLKSDITISSGNGTINNPYIV